MRTLTRSFRLEGRPLRAIPWALAATQAALLLPTYALFGVESGRLPDLLQFGWWERLAPLLGLEFAVVGAMILRRHPRHRVGWLALAGGFSTNVSVFSGAYAGYSISVHVLPFASIALWVRGWLWYVGLVSLFVALPLVFPDGNLLSRRWRPLMWAVLVGCVAQVLMVTLTEALYGFPRPDGPYPQLGWLLAPLTPLSGICFLAPLIGAVASTALRYKRADPSTRQQLKWFLATVVMQAALWAVAQAVSAFSGQSPYEVAILDVLIPLALLLIPLAIGIAILRHRLYDIDLVISRGLAYSGLAIFITSAYLLVVVGVGVLLGTGGRPNLVLSVVAMALVALLIQPLRQRLEQLANRLVYGIPADPYAILAEIARTTGTTDADRALARIAQAVARGIGGRQVRVHLRLASGDEQVASWPAGAAGPFPHRFDVVHAGEAVGEIEAEAAGEAALGDALMVQAGLALRTLRLSSELAARLRELEFQAHELAASRTRLVQAQETERRRLERDLHDGIQQELVVLIAKARLARNELARDPATAGTTLADLQASAQRALTELRALTRGIHPAVLSSRGLVEAVEAMAARAPLDVRVVAEDRVRASRFPPEIEGAAYFGVAEALSNVIKHAEARTVIVDIGSGAGGLNICVSDDGRGFDAKAAVTSGLRGLRDRVEALGGDLEIQRLAPGTRLRLSLPVSAAAHA